MMEAEPIIIISGKEYFQPVDSVDIFEEEDMSGLPSDKKKPKIFIHTFSKKISGKTLWVALLIILILAISGFIAKEISLQIQSIQNKRNGNIIQSHQQNKESYAYSKEKDFRQQINNASLSKFSVSPPQLSSSTQDKVKNQPFEKIDPTALAKIEVIQPPPLQPSSSIQSQISQKYHSPFTEHKHLPIQFTYPTMGMRLPNTFFNFTEVAPDQYYQYQSKMDQLFKPFNDTDCELQRFGDRGDGGYLLCKNLVNKSVALINLGVEGRDMFGCQLTSQFRIPNYQYDCTQSSNTPCSTNDNANVFEYGCIGQVLEYTEGYQYYSLKDIIDLRNLTHKHVIMKIDIQGAEWPGFRTFPMEYLDFVDQLVMEIHNPAPNIRQKAFWGNIDIIQSLKDKFVSVNLHSNTGACYYGSDGQRHKLPAFALEVSLVNKNIINMQTASRSYALNDKNSLNGGGNNCQMKD